MPDWVADRLSGPAVKTYFVILQLSHGKPARLPVRLIAARRGLEQRMIRYHLAEMARAGVLRVVAKRIGPRMNDHNTYILLDIDGRDLHLVSAKNCREKPIQILKGLKAPLARAVERREHDHPPAMRKLHEHNARLMSENRGLRLILKSHKPREKRRRGGATPEMTAGEIAQAFDGCPILAQQIAEARRMGWVDDTEVVND